MQQDPHLTTLGGLSVRLAGHPSDPALLLIHGFPSSCAAWIEHFVARVS